MNSLDRRLVVVCALAALITVPLVASAQPPAATRGIATGELIGPKLTFTWGSVPSATWYYLWINDRTGPKFQQWYTAAQLGCELRSLCGISIEPSLEPGTITWWIQTWSPQGFGAWSEPHTTRLRDSGEGAFGVYDAQGLRFGAVVDFQPELPNSPGDSVVARVTLDGRPFMLRVFPTEVKGLGIGGDPSQVLYQDSGCTGPTMLWAVPQQIIQPVVITQPGAVVWVPTKQGQAATRSVRSYSLDGVCTEVDWPNASTYPAMSLGPFPYSPRYTIR